MRRQQTSTSTGRTWRAPRNARPTGGARSGRRATPRAMPFVGARGRAATSAGRFGGLHPGRRRAAGRGKQSSANRVAALGRGLLGAVGKNQPSKGSRKGPALLAVFAGLGVAGVAALKRRRSGDDQSPGYVPPPEPVGESAPPLEAAPPSGTA